MLNNVTLMGRLTRDPELKYTAQNIPVCTITLAVERDFADSNGVREADFFDIVCWRNNAEFVARYFKKGILIACIGKLQSRRWTDKQGQNRTSIEVIADHCYFAERIEVQGHDTMKTGADTKPTPRYPEFREQGSLSGDLPVSDFEEYEEDDVPF